MNFKLLALFLLDSSTYTIYECPCCNHNIYILLKQSKADKTILINLNIVLHFVVSCF